MIWRPTHTKLDGRIDGRVRHRERRRGHTSFRVEDRFDVTIGDRAHTLAAGSFIVPANLVHGVKALETGRLVDSFTPHRADILA
jgi:quercetin dioxygenase-like cupin family protein